MNYVVLDLEWNQPISFESSIYRKIGDKLLFELIQIGAVKVNENREIIDAISLPIKPTHYVKIHPRIQRLTQLTKENFVNAPSFNEAMDLFTAWCGEDYVLVVWGNDDTSVLQQNIDFFKWNNYLPPLCDLQHYFSDWLKLGKERKGLKYAMELLEIEEDEQLGFHNALNDAYYTAQVFQKVPKVQQITAYPTTPKKLARGKKRVGEVHFTLPNIKIKKLLALPKLKMPLCPYCKKTTNVSSQYVLAGNNQYMNIASCKDHGDLFVFVKIKQDNEKDQVHMKITRASKQKKAYIHTKSWKEESVPSNDVLEKEALA